VTIKQLYVAGAGLMGAGIAQTAISHGFDVTLREVDDNLVNRGVENIKRRLDSLVQKGKLEAAQRDAALARLHPTTSLEAAGRADFVIEAITENFDAKRDLFKRLDGICREEAILASNTSSIPVTRMAAVTKRPDRFIGMHFFNPVPVMPLVELTRGRDTSDATLAATLELSKALGKTPITSLDYPGFIVNRMLVPFINEARTSTKGPDSGCTTRWVRSNLPILSAWTPISTSAACSTRDSTTRGLPRPPCSASWSMPATSDERVAAASIVTVRTAPAYPIDARPRG